MEPVLSLRGLAKTYRLPWGKGTWRALAGLDLEVGRGEVVGLLGPNGSGKSTTFKLILGFIRPTAGEIRLFGAPAGRPEARRRLAFVPENPAFPRHLRGEEALRLYGRLSGLSGPELSRRIGAALERTGLSGAGRRPVHGYSRGMLQRLALAQALLHDPDLLLLDEPTAGIDPAGARAVRALLAELKAEGKTLLFSSHLLEEVEAVADRVVLLDRGRKAAEGPLADLLAVPGADEIEVRGLPPAARERVAAFLREEGAAEVAFRPARRSLESFFLEETGR
ncbi:MAG: ABC transporter ATP-binding protein [Verrucomicrobium sp.]|nr:ABC transporter ATP-binding protein [Verrucomicrobium sp.]